MTSSAAVRYRTPQRAEMVSFASRWFFWHVSAHSHVLGLALDHEYVAFRTLGTAYGEGGYILLNIWNINLNIC